MPPKKAQGSKKRASSSMADEDIPIFFFMAKEKPYGIFCQWYFSKFTVTRDSLDYLQRDAANPFALPEHIKFNCTEQYMMYAKAIYFNDAESGAKIMDTPDPKEQKRLGRQVAGFDDAEWAAVRERVGEQGNWAKFTQNPALRAVLLATGDKELVEAAGRDRIWGIGYNANQARITLRARRRLWGLNLLGKCLMRVRERIRELEKKDRPVVEVVES